MMKILCVFGEHQYGDPSRGRSTEYCAFIPALKRLGHEVVHFESWNRTHYKDFKELNISLIETVKRERPDILLAVQIYYEIWIETLQLIKENEGVATVYWTTDDSWKYREVSRFVGHFYNAITTTYDYVLDNYHKDSIDNVLLTQWAAKCDFLQEPLPANMCQYSISFIGAAHGDRKKVISQLKSLGYEVNCFGHGWENGPIQATDIPKIIRESVISLNFANSRGINQIKARTFEVPGAGGFLLTEYTPGLEKFYEIDKEIATFNSLNALADKLRHFLENPDERDKIALAGFMRTKSQHTYDLRLKEVLDFTLVSKTAVISSPPKYPIVSFEEAVIKHKMNIWLKGLRHLLLTICSFIWGKIRGPRAARRITFEFCWRVFGYKTFTSSGLPGRMFYLES